MLRYILIFLAFLPLIELWLLLLLGELIGAGPTIVLVILTGVGGLVLFRWQGFSTWRTVQRSLQHGELPTEGLADRLMMLLAGILLMLPGVLTDVIGFSLLVPYCRRWYRRLAMAWFRRRVEVRFGSFGAQRQERVEVIDSYVVPRREEPGPPGIDHER
jgi:UPF0716 protein FxsA